MSSDGISEEDINTYGNLWAATDFGGSVLGGILLGKSLKDYWILQVLTLTFKDSNGFS